MAEVGGAQLYFRARTPHRAVFAGASALFLVALSGWSNSDLSTEHTKLPLAGGALGRRGLQDAGGYAGCRRLKAWLFASQFTLGYLLRLTGLYLSEAQKAQESQHSSQLDILTIIKKQPY
eukprot:SAG25_NODE_372_length_8977_cov_25.225839_11_plen_120_part_00